MSAMSDGDGFLYLTDRATFMIISGGVNIYPQECENLFDHPSQDRRRRGIRRANPDLGEESEGVVAADARRFTGPELADELIAFCSQSLSRQKVPRSIDFERNCHGCPPENSTNACWRDRYWGNKTSRIV